MTAVKKPAHVVAAVVAFLILGTAAGAVPGRAYVLWTGSKVYVTDDGLAWRQVTPRGAVKPGTFRAIDAVAFRGTREGWLIASDCATGRGSVYRSFDGGRSWRTYAFHAHSCAGGANFSLDVLNGKLAWVLQNEPTSPTARLYRTTNGGRTWHVVRKLAEYGKVAFVSPTTGWLAGLRLLQTVDGGRTWHLQSLPAPRGYRGRLVLLTAPRFFGRQGLLAGQYGGRPSRDRLLPGERWRPPPASARHVAGLGAWGLSPVRSQRGHGLGSLAADGGREASRVRHSRRRSPLVESRARPQALRAGCAQRAPGRGFRFSRQAVHHP